jgi:hypothetical protein
MNTLRLLSLAGFALCLWACQASVGTGGFTSVPKDAAATCGEHCAEIGMALDSVVIMANNVGCVCRSSRSPAAQGAAGPAAGGMAAIVVEEEARQQQQQAAHH